MMSVFAMKVLGKTPILTGVASYPNLKGIGGDLPSYVQLAYQFQIMGIESDRSPLYAWIDSWIARAEGMDNAHAYESWS